MRRLFPILSSALVPLFLGCGLFSGCGRVMHAAAPHEQRTTLATGVAARWLELGDPRGEPVLFLHGYTDSNRSFLGTMQALERLAELRAPTLVLAATQDRMSPEEPVQRELCEALARAHARHGTPWAWKRYGRAPLPASGVPDDLGHNFHWSAPEAVARDLAAFLRPGGAPTDEEVFVAPGTGRVTVAAEGAHVLGPLGLR